MTPAQADDVNEWSGDASVTVRSSAAAKNVRLMVEAVAAGLAFGSLLGWASTCLVGIFRPQDLADPYWQGIPWLRTDTAGFISFIIAAISLICTEYLRLRRRQASVARADSPTGNSPAISMLLAVSKTVTVLGAGLVTYLSFNTITHPWSQQLQVSHLLPWPSEGTLRVAALVLCVCSVTIYRYVRGRSTFVV